MELYFAVRNILGFLVQVVPCAALCFIPFPDRLRRGRRRTYGAVALVLAVALIPFTIVGSLDFGLERPTRYVAQNAVFFAALAVLLALYARAVDAPAAQKLFVFFVVMCYGYLVTQTEEYVINFFGSSDIDDGHMYAPGYLITLAIMTAVFFAPMAALMRYLRSMLSAPVDSRTWRRMTAVPIALIAAMFLGGRLPAVAGVTQGGSMYYLLMFSVEALAVFLMWWMLFTVREASREASKRSQLEAALEQRSRDARKLAGELKSAQERASRLEESLRAQADAGAGAGGAPEESPVVLSTPSQAVSFLASDVLYAESLNRTRIVHLQSGESFQVNTTLAQIVSQLPEGLFVYCHRSIAVNLDCVLSVEGDELLLRGGTKVPVSRRRLQDVRDALTARAAGH